MLLADLLIVLLSNEAAEKASLTVTAYLALSTQ